MAGRIPQTFIDDLIDRTDIVEVVNSRVSLKKTGKNYSACCPFHNEKTPSFTVSPQKQFYHCFGCGASGNAIGFVMDHDNVDFLTALEELAQQAGMEIPRESREPDRQQKKRRDIYSQLETADKLYRTELRKSNIAINYLKSRGLSGEIARDYGLGFAPDKWDSLAKPAEADATTTRLLEEGGMLIKRDKADGFYDRFRNRVMFPIRDQRGRTIAFGGRVLGDEKPKYLNSPETPVFHKSRELYGLYEMLQSRGKPQNAIIVEGYMDVVALAQYGINNTVATLGTSVGQPHLEKLFRHVSEVIFCFDGDDAGRKAAERALEACLPTMLDGRQASFLFLPDGEDPDTRVRDIGKEAFLQETQNALPLTDFMFQQASAGLKLDSDDQKALLAHRLLPLIQAMPEGLLQKMLLQRLSEQTGLTADQLSTVQPKIKPKAQENIQPEPSAQDHEPPPDKMLAELEEAQEESPLYMRLKGLVLQLPDLALSPKLDNPNILEEPGSELFQQVRELLSDYPDAEFTTIWGYWMGRDQEKASELNRIYASTILSDAPREKLEQEFNEVIDRWLATSKKEKTWARLNELKAIPFEELTDEQRAETQKLFELLK